MLHEQRGIRLVVWGDDFTFLGRDPDLKWVAVVMTVLYEIKIRAILGNESHDDKEVRILNRKVRWEVDQILHEGDEKHVGNDHPRDGIAERFAASGQSCCARSGERY